MSLVNGLLGPGALMIFVLTSRQRLNNEECNGTSTFH